MSSPVTWQRMEWLGSPEFYTPSVKPEVPVTVYADKRGNLYAAPAHYTTAQVNAVLASRRNGIAPVGDIFGDIFGFVGDAFNTVVDAVSPVVSSVAKVGAQVADVVLPVAGGIVGLIYGGPTGAALGASAGKLVAGLNGKVVGEITNDPSYGSSPGGLIGSLVGASGNSSASQIVYAGQQTSATTQVYTDPAIPAIEAYITSRFQQVRGTAATQADLNTLFGQVNAFFASLGTGASWSDPRIKSYIDGTLLPAPAAGAASSFTALGSQVTTALSGGPVATWIPWAAGGAALLVIALLSGRGGSSGTPPTRTVVRYRQPRGRTVHFRRPHARHSHR